MSNESSPPQQFDSRIQRPDEQVNVQRTPSVSEEIDLLSLLRVLWRGKWIIGLFVFVFGASTVYYLQAVAVPTFRATSVVALDAQQNNIVDIESVVSGVSGDLASINTEVEVLKSRLLVERVVDILDLDELPQFNATLRDRPLFSVAQGLRMVGLGGTRRELTPEEIKNAVIDAVLRSYTVNNVRSSYVFQITAQTENAALSRDLANALADTYIERQVEAKFEGTNRATLWLTERVAQLQIELEAAEQRAKDLSVQTDLVSPEALAAQERQIKELRDRVVDTQVSVASLDQKIALLEDTTDPLEFARISNDQALERLVNSGSVDTHTFRTRQQQVLDQLIAGRARTASQIEALQSSLELLETSAAEQSQDLVQLRQLQREAEASRQIYEFFLNRLKETSVQQGIHAPDSRVLSLAVAPRSPASPRKATTTAMMVLVGAVLGAALVLLRELTQSTFRTSEAIEEETSYRVIGQLPLMPVSRREKIFDYLLDKPTSAAMEAIRNLRTTVLMQSIDKPPQVLLSTSALPSEGKTTTSIGLAINLAGMGKNVLLVEGDIRRRVFREYFDIKGTKGLVSVLSGEATLEEAIHHNKKANLDVLQGESSMVNAADLYSSQTFGRLIATLRERYDYIVIDTPPVLLVPDARVIASYADSILFTVKWDATQKSAVKRALRSLEDVNLTVNGIVLSQMDNKRLKSYGYDSYGGYGKSGYYHS